MSQTNNKFLSQMSAFTIKGNNGGSTANPLDLTVAQVNAILPVFTSSLNGLTPSSGGGTSNFLRADGTWTTAGTVSPLTTKGDIYTYSTVNARQPVPADYGDLIADSTQATGWRDATYTQTQGKPGKNYIQYADFENNATTGWTLGTIGTLTNGLPTGSPTFGSGASGNLSISATSSSIEGAYSLSYASSAATTAGDMVVTSSYAIDTEDQAKVLTVKFYYNVPSGAANCNFSGTSSNSFAWAIYDVTNSSWLTSSGNFNLVQSSGCGYVTGTCQTNSNTSNIRLVVYNANATSGAATMTLDGFYVGPQTAPSGPAMTDLITYTPTFVGFGTPTNLAWFYQRIGDSLYIEGSHVNGTHTGSIASMSLPSGLNVDTSKITLLNTTSNPGTMIGQWSGDTVGAFGSMITAPGTSTSLVYFGDDGAGQLTPTLGSSIIASGGAFSCKFVVPISGWSSNSSMSADTDTRVVDFSGTKGSTQSVTANTTDITVTSVKDSHAAWNGSQYVVPVTGDYVVSCLLADNGAGNNTFSVYVNGSISRTLGAGLSGNFGGGSVLIPSVAAGSTLSIRTNITTTLAAAGSISIFRLSGPAVITATESVNVRYHGASGTLTSGTDSLVTFTTKDFDSHNEYSSGLYTCPTSGKYQINAKTISTDATGSFSAGISIYKNGSQVSISYTGGVSIAATSNYYSQISDIVGCLAGDTLAIYLNNNGTTPSLVASANGNTLSLCRVGN